MREGREIEEGRQVKRGRRRDDGDDGSEKERGNGREIEEERKRDRVDMLRKSGGAKPPLASQAAGRQPLSQSTP